MSSPDLISPYLDWWSLAAWTGINILVPVLLPLLVLWLFSIPNVMATLTAGCMIKSIGKGELFWAAMGMAASTCYELFALQKIVTNPHGYGIAWLVFWIHLGVILGSAIMVGVGSLNNRRPAAGSRHIPDRRVFIASIAVLTFTVCTYTSSHAVLSALEEEIKEETRISAKREKEAIMKKLRSCLESNTRGANGHSSESNTGMSGGNQMTSIATKLENDARLRDRTVNVALTLMGIGAAVSLVGMAILIRQVL